MTVSELMAILTKLDGDTEVFTIHERVKIASPELFLAYKTISELPDLVIVPAKTSAFEDATERDYWLHVKSAETLCG